MSLRVLVRVGLLLDFCVVLGDLLGIHLQGIVPLRFVILPGQKNSPGDTPGCQSRRPRQRLEEFGTRHSNGPSPTVTRQRMESTHAHHYTRAHGQRGGGSGKTGICSSTHKLQSPRPSPTPICVPRHDAPRCVDAMTRARQDGMKNATANRSWRDVDGHYFNKILVWL